MNPTTPPPDLTDLIVPWRDVLYLACAAFLGGIAAISSLLGDPAKSVTFRAVVAYLTAGSLTSAGIVMLLADQFGFSYPLMAVGIFASYKAVDTIAVVAVAIGNVVSRILGAWPPKDK
jgi:hypothetical protein